MNLPAALPAVGFDRRALADRILARVQRVGLVWGTYSLDLTFDALLEYHLATGAESYRNHVLEVMRRRNVRVEHYSIAERRPFGQLHYTIYRCLGAPSLADAFVRESRLLRKRVDRSPDGLVLHRSGRRPPAVLVDFMQDYIAHMARAGHLTGETTFFAEAEEQVRLYGALLRDPGTGLWRQGRGWDTEDPDALSPGAWSRGQGWVLRGLLDALDALPEGLPSMGVLQDVLRELLDALLIRQDDQGFWHCMVDRSFENSAPETSGTALIAAALYRSLAAGHLQGAVYRRAADRALSAVAGRVDKSGRVAGACAGPGPLTGSLADRYLGSAFPEDEAHGWFTVLYALAAHAAMMSGAGRSAVAPRV